MLRAFCDLVLDMLLICESTLLQLSRIEHTIITVTRRYMLRRVPNLLNSLERENIAPPLKWIHVDTDAKSK